MDTIAAFYREQSAYSSPGRHQAAIDALPRDITKLLEIVQGLMIYDAVAGPFYGYEIPRERQDEIHLQTLEDMLDRVFALDARPLAVARPVTKRLAARCRSFMIFLIAALRNQGVPARARCGFGAYFNPGYFEDHWLCEYWDGHAQQWKLADAQFDEVWRKKLRIEHNIADVPRDRFLVASDAWRACRSGHAQASQFGIEFAHLRGLWYVAGNLVRDLAALNRIEVRPWDVWGAQPEPDAELDDDSLALFDRLAALTRDPDATFTELRETFETSEALRTPETVFNALLQRPEASRAH